MSWFRSKLLSLLIDGQVLVRSGNGFAGAEISTLTPAGAWSPDANNTRDLGLTGTRWRTAYLGTALVTPLIRDTNGASALTLGATASAVNGVTLTNAATGNAPVISASGADTDVSLALSGKGAGAVMLSAPGTDNALGIDATGIRVDTGTDTSGTPTVSRSSGIVRVASAATEVTVTNALCTVNSKVFAQIRNQTSNPVSILSVEPGAGSFVVRLSGDPGASHANIAFFMVQPDA